ncbi:MAG: hypothetical protein WAX69_02950 [Victivallales bacterium]
MNHFASPDFWICYNKLPPEIQSLADGKYELLKKNHLHPSLHLKKIRNYWSVRAGLNYRALGIDTPDKDGIIWFWIGNHSEYEKLINPR